MVEPAPGEIDQPQGEGPFVVIVRDNFHYMDKDEWWTLGAFPAADEAIAAAKPLVQKSLDEAYEAGMSADSLFGRYKGFGDDPFVVAKDDEQIEFSSWDYARARCDEMLAEQTSGADSAG